MWAHSCSTKNKVLIDGEAVKPIVDRVNFVTVGLKGIKVVEPPERLEVSTAILGVILTYFIDGIPQQVTVDWELFTPQIQRFRPHPRIRPDRSRLSWSRTPPFMSGKTISRIIVFR